MIIMVILRIQELLRRTIIEVKMVEDSSRMTVCVLSTKNERMIEREERIDVMVINFGPSNTTAGTMVFMVDNILNPKRVHFRYSFFFIHLCCFSVNSIGSKIRCLCTQWKQRSLSRNIFFSIPRDFISSIGSNPVFSTMIKRAKVTKQAVQMET